MASISLNKLRKIRVFKAEPFTTFTMLNTVLSELEADQEEFLKLMLDDVSSNEFPHGLDCAS